MNRMTVALSLIVVMGLGAVLAGGDCPRFRGPAGDGQFPETGLLKQWPAGGPKIAWTAKGLGQGYSSATVANDTVYVTGMDDQNQGYLFAFAPDGKMYLVKPNAAAFEPVSQFTVAEGTNEHWAHPTIANGRLYIRHGDALVVYEIKG